jgi:hypothetical protein
MKNSTILFSALASVVLIGGCGNVSDSTSGGTDSGSTQSVTASLSAAASYIDESLPNLGNSVGFHKTALSALNTSKSSFSAINLILTSNWGSTSAGDKTDPPGGVYQSGQEPNYGGSAMPSTVNYRDYLKMSLDSQFKRGTEEYRPTLFGRFDNLISILTYLGQTSIEKGPDGLPVVGTHNTTLSVSGMGTVSISAEVSNPASTTYYDKRMFLRGYADLNTNSSYDAGTDLLLFENLIWARSNSTELNMLQVELQDKNGSAGILDRMGFNVIKWNRSTGKLAFEHSSAPDDNSGQVEHYRYLVESSTGKQYFYSLQSRMGINTEYTQIAMYTPTPTSTQGTVSLRDIRNNGDVWLGNLCVTFANGVGASSDNDPADEASGGTCAGHTDAINSKAGLMGVGNTIINTYDQWQDVATAKGFPTSDWSNTTNRNAWLNAGDAVTVSIGNRADFMNRFAGSPSL